jgi:hypothetical protein
VKDSYESQLSGSKSLVVLNGQYYCGENKEENKLVFLPERSKAIRVDERRVRFIIQSILRWNMSGEISLRRLEILKAGGVKNV